MRHLWFCAKSSVYHRTTSLKEKRWLDRLLVAELYRSGNRLKAGRVAGTWLAKEDSLIKWKLNLKKAKAAAIDHIPEFFILAHEGRGSIKKLS